MYVVLILIDGLPFASLFLHFLLFPSFLPFFTLSSLVFFFLDGPTRLISLVVISCIADLTDLIRSNVIMRSQK